MAAPSSGTGKTTLTCGLARLLRNLGYKVQCFKVGPDFLDPGFLTAASGQKCLNLDLWMCGEDSVRRTVQVLAEQNDFILVEGVMGLYDGADARSDFGSTSHLAKVLDAPVLMVLDAGGCARSMAAMAQGFQEFADAPKFLGIIANRIGSAGHLRMLCESLESTRAPLPILGGIPKNAPHALPERHLGLVQAEEMQNLDEILDQIAGVLQAHLDLDLLIQTAPEYKTQKLNAPQFKTRNLRVGLAQDAAFSFYYPDFIEALRARGAEILTFSPLLDSHLPAACDLLIFGGGYPELHLQALSSNQSLMQEIRDHARSKGAIYAECGGLMYLSQGIIPAEAGQDCVPMVGLLPSKVQMQKKLHYLGYVQVELSRDCLLGPRGTKLRGHEYHHSVLSDEILGWETAYLCTDARNQNPRTEGYTKDSMLISYVHLPLAAFEQALDHLCQLQKS